MSFDVVGIKLVADNAAQYTASLAAGDKAVAGFSAANAAAAAKVNFFDDSLKKIKIEGLTNKLTEQQKALNILQQELTQTTTKYGEGSVQAQKKQLAVDKLTNSIGLTEKQIGHENTALDQERAAFDASSHAASGLGKATIEAGDDAAKTAPRFDAFREVVVGALRAVGQMAVQAFADAARAAAGFFKDSISAAGDFESGMNKFAAVAGGALEESGLKLSDFRDQFIQIGKELPVSTAEVQQAAIEMVKGGIDPATIAAGGLRQVIQFAAAADLDLTQAATIAAKALGGWVSDAATAQERADFLTHSTDLLSKAANASTVNVDDLALGLYNVQGTAKLAGVSFDETVTALAELAPSFASSADAGTSFKTFITSLQPHTKPAIAAMTDLGLMTTDTGKIIQFLSRHGIKPLGDDLDTLGNQFTEFATANNFTAKATTKLWDSFSSSKFYDAQGNFVGMAKASELLHDATKDLTEAQRVQTLQQLFGQDGIRVAAVLAEKGADGYNAMTDALMKQNNVQDMAKQKQAGFNTALDNFKGSIEALQITIGSVLLPVLTDLFNNYLAPGINIITDLANAGQVSDETFKNLSPTMQGVATAITDIVNGIPVLIQGFTDAYTAISPIIDFVGANLIPILASLAAMIITAVVPSFTAWAAVAGPAALATITAMAPVILTIAAVGAAVAILVKAWTDDWGGIRTAVMEFWTTTGQPIFDELVVWLGDTIPKAIAILADYWTTTLQPALQRVWAFISGSIIPIIGTLVGTTFKVLVAGIVELANFWTNTLWPALQKVWDFIDSSIIPLFKALVNVHMAVMGKALQTLTGFWEDTLLPAITAVYNWFNDNIVPVFARVDSGSSDVANAINNVLGPAFQWLGDHVLSPIVDWFGSITSHIQDAVDWLNKLADTINSLPGVPDQYEGHSPPPIAQWMDAIAQSSTNAATGISAAIEAVMNAPTSIPSWLNGGGGSSGGGVWGNDGGGDNGGGIWGNGLRAAGIASAAALMGRGGNSSATYNQQRTANITYHTQQAPPVPHSMAIAAALGAN